jgi:hypothetical protein
MSLVEPNSAVIGVAVSQIGNFLIVTVELFHSGAVNDAMKERPCRHLRFE